jgi:hypothetical protein
MRGETHQFVKADERDLRTLPVVDGGVELQVRKLDLACATRGSEMRSPTDIWTEILGSRPIVRRDW